MPDAQNQRNNSRGDRRGRSRRRGKQQPQQTFEDVAPVPEPVIAEPVKQTAETPPAKFVRPDNIAAPAERMEVYCTHHLAILPELEPVNTRPNSEMTTLRHLAVDHFGEATLYCDCLHNGPHEWPPSLQKIETAIELDQFLTASTNEA